MEVIITYFMIAWIEKHHSQNQYSLIVKKARSWLKKVMEDNHIEEPELEEIKKYI